MGQNIDGIGVVSTAAAAGPRPPPPPCPTGSRSLGRPPGRISTYHLRYQIVQLRFRFFFIKCNKHFKSIDLIVECWWLDGLMCPDEIFDNSLYFPGAYLLRANGWLSRRWCGGRQQGSYCRRSKLWPSIDHLAIVYLLLTRPPLDWRSLCYQTKLLQSGGGRASNK